MTYRCGFTTAYKGSRKVDVVKPKPWNMTIGMLIGLLTGTALWWGSYVPGAGMFQNLQLVIVPAAIAILVVSVRNKRKQVGPYDPEVIARNKRGRL